MRTDVVDRAAANAQRALDTPRLTLEQLAERTATTTAALNKYRIGARRMPADVRLRLAATLEAHARELAAIADLLRQDAAAER